MPPVSTRPPDFRFSLSRGHRRNSPVTHGLEHRLQTRAAECRRRTRRNPLEAKSAWMTVAHPMGRGPGGVADAAVLSRPLSPACSQGTPPTGNDAQGGAPKHAPSGNVSLSALALAYRRTTPRICRLLTCTLRFYQATDAGQPP